MDRMEKLKKNEMEIRKSEKIQQKCTRTKEVQNMQDGCP